MSTLFCYMNGQKVGELEQRKDYSLYFSYDEKWLKSDYGRPISLSMPLSPKKYSAEVVYNYLENLLPDLTEVRKKVQRQVGTASSEPFDLLSAVGKDCVGALQFLTEDQYEINKQEGRGISDSDISQLLQDLKVSPLGIDTDGDFRLLIAGAQSKTALFNDKSQWKVPIGMSSTTHILKLPIGEVTDQNIPFDDSVDNECYCMWLAQEFGLNTAKSTIAQFDNSRAFIVERFDRKEVSEEQTIYRLPQEDMCQVFNVNSELKYQSNGGIGIEKIYKLLVGSDNPEDRQAFMRAQIFNWLIAGIDAHAKNYSIMLLPNGLYELSPLYDLMSAHPLFERGLRDREIKMAMGLRGGSGLKYRWTRLTTRNFFTTAKAVGYSIDSMQEDLEMFYDTAQNTIEKTTAKIISAIPHIDQQVIESINRGILRVISRKPIVNPYR